MAFSWFKTRRRRALLEEPFPAAWREYLAANMRHYAYLQPHEQALVETVVRVVVAEIHWFGGPRFDVTEEMKVTVAAQASLLVLGFEEPYFFDRLQSIILYPGVYMHPRQLRRYTGLTARLLGEAWYHSPIVLSWRAVLTAGRDEADGHNVVLHEFAHYLDGLDGSIDGTPPLEDRDQETAWYQVTETEYRRLVGQARRGEQALLDHYGATNRAEFFAVVTECFFERPQALRREHKALYERAPRLLPARPGPVAARRPDRPPRDRPARGRPAGGRRRRRPATLPSPTTPTRCLRWPWTRRDERTTSWPSGPLPGPSNSIRATWRPTSSGPRHESSWASSPLPWPIVGRCSA